MYGFCFYFDLLLTLSLEVLFSIHQKGVEMNTVKNIHKQSSVFPSVAAELVQFPASLHKRMNLWKGKARNLSRTLKTNIKIPHRDIFEDLSGFGLSFWHTIAEHSFSSLPLSSTPSLFPSLPHNIPPSLLSYLITFLTVWLVSRRNM